MNIADLHCDLLCYLADDLNRTALSDEVRCSVSQLKKGNVSFQTMAIFTETGKCSVASAQKQLDIFSSLPSLYPETFTLEKREGKVQIAAAIENASGLCSEEEPLEMAFKRFESFQERNRQILYVSLTWNQENRFAGGNATQIGLKRDGELFLEYLNGKKTAIDLSHTSDETAYDILNYINKRGLEVIPIASHSNFRTITPVPRNLPDALAKEILKKGGVIGLNFFKAFVGRDVPEDFIRQVEHARSLGAIEHFCFGADFFYDKQLPVSSYSQPFYYEPFGNAGCYPELIAYLGEAFTQKEIEQIAYKNFTAFLNRI